ncbi:hypothetical protein UFOVP1146_345 [uncultured Caudovirales phage]|jgi:hypothetical protein|uniref:Uncharacterized protein n=1 Tax=uncultured Caudovirales phage TaxID=2100421 RepID=A0A6J5T0J1_9CAUD|nr:hypothetical protein UFOVP812_258 [uncultured Caudovirales phage]CAB4165771.1 hypothetical protein UFOVP818_307 [uncultured Caudovirales phage]CAB4186999.1 hypothetical protein UFOVP1146_345 [uncultured Caudovirales phage]CAB4221238.1 hypothetical protein UFOVP1638_220 [uncultured Caudovirales phage]
MKTNATFKLKKSIKTVMATSKFKNQDQETAYRQIMIAAQVESDRVVKKLERIKPD